MLTSVFVEIRFWLLIVLSFVVPTVVYFSMHRRRFVSSATVLALGALLVAIAGVDVYLLQVLETLARQTRSLVDDAIFASELSVALYIVPVCFAGIGINIVSHVIVAHLTRAEARYAAEHRRRPVETHSSDARGGEVVDAEEAV
jgi:hypothetical protein